MSSPNKSSGGSGDNNNSRSNNNGTVSFKQFKAYRAFWEGIAANQSEIIRALIIEVGAVRQWVSQIDPAFAKQALFMHDSDNTLKRFEADDIKTGMRKMLSLLIETGIIMNQGNEECSSSTSIPRYNPELRAVYKSYIKPSISLTSNNYADSTPSWVNEHHTSSSKSIASPRPPNSSSSKPKAEKSLPSKTQKNQTNCEPVPAADVALAEAVKLIQILLAANNNGKPAAVAKPNDVEHVELPGSRFGDGDGDSKSSGKRSFDAANVGLDRDTRIESILVQLSDLKEQLGCTDAKIAKLNGDDDCDAESGDK